MLAIQGTDDQYGTIRQIQSIKGHAPSAETRLIEDCRHSPHLEHPEHVLTIMTRFIQGILTQKKS
jgi:pimeloyl-ACP methyl ester carboxylesterase